jgi:hypothetical protein
MEEAMACRTTYNNTIQYRSLHSSSSMNSSSLCAGRSDRRTYWSRRRRPHIGAGMVGAIILLSTMISPYVDAVLPHLGMDIVVRQVSSSSSTDPTSYGTTTTLSTMFLSHAYFGAPLPMKTRNGGYTKRIPPMKTMPCYVKIYPHRIDSYRKNLSLRTM